MLRLTSLDPVPDDLRLSGATFSFTPTTGNASVSTCTTDDLGTCTVTGLLSVTDDETDVVLTPGEYIVSQTSAATGLAAAPGPIGTLAICLVLCEDNGTIEVTNASLFRTQVVATVVDSDGEPVAGQAFSIAGQTYAGHLGDVYALDAESSDAAGRLVFDGWFAPGDWTFTPTTPAGFEPLAAQQHTLTTTQAQAAAREPWLVSLVREELVAVPPVDPETDGEGHR